MDPTPHVPDLASTVVPLITGPAAAVVVSLLALWKLWGRVEKMIDSLQVLVKDNTKAMDASTAASAAQVEAMKALTSEVRIALQNGIHREVSQPGMRVVTGQGE